MKAKTIDIISNEFTKILRTDSKENLTYLRGRIMGILELAFECDIINKDEFESYMTVFTSLAEEQDKHLTCIPSPIF